MRAKTSLIDLVNALESTTPGLHWRLDTVTGDLFPSSEARAAEPEAGRLRSLPRAAELPEHEMRLDFCARLRDPELRAALTAAADRGASRRAFQLGLRAAGLLDEWTAHRRARLASVALAWAAEQHVTCRGDARSPSFAVN